MRQVCIVVLMLGAFVADIGPANAEHCRPKPSTRRGRAESLDSTRLTHVMWIAREDRPEHENR